jgi:hypothetical protein
MWHISNKRKEEGKKNFVYRPRHGRRSDGIVSVDVLTLCACTTVPKKNIALLNSGHRKLKTSYTYSNSKKREGQHLVQNFKF